MKILILGHTGFVGRNFIEEFQNSNFEIVKKSKSTGLDLTDLPSVIREFNKIKPDIIVNLAAVVGSLNYVTEKAAKVVDQNMRMILNIYNAITENNLKTIIINPIANCGFPGNLEIYKESDFWSGTVHRSVLSFGSTRRMIDVVSQCYKMQYGIKSINYFVPNMYGPHESTDPNKAHALDALVSKFVKAKKEDIPIVEVWGDGSPVREWLYVKDFVQIIIISIENCDKMNYEKPINVGQQYGLSIRELVKIIIKKTDFKGKVNWKTDMPNGAPKKIMSNEVFRQRFPDFKFTTFDEGIQETIEYYKSIYPY